MSGRRGMCAVKCACSISRRDFAADRVRRLVRPGGTGRRIVAELAIKAERVGGFFSSDHLGSSSAIRWVLMGWTVSGERTTLAVIKRAGYLGFEPFPGELAHKGEWQTAPPRTTPWRLATSGRPGARTDGLTAMKRNRRSRGVPGAVDGVRAGPGVPPWFLKSSETTGSRGETRRRRPERPAQDRLGLGWADHDHPRQLQLLRPVSRGYGRVSPGSRTQATRAVSRPSVRVGGAQVLRRPSRASSPTSTVSLAENQTKLRPLCVPRPARPSTRRVWSRSTNRRSRRECTIWKLQFELRMPCTTFRQFGRRDDGAILKLSCGKLHRGRAVPAGGTARTGLARL